MQQREQLMVNGLTREFLMYVPSSAGINISMPVVISLHGTLGSAEQMMGFADFRPLADREQFIIVCPEGITQTWNDGRATKANQAGIDDVGFIDQLITHLINVYQADESRIYLTGMSNGGFMVSRLACEIPHRLAAMAAVAATLDKLSSIRPAKPLPAMYIHGTKDRLVPYAGGPTKAAGGQVFSHEEMLKLWADVNACVTPPAVTQLPDTAQDGTSVTQQVFNNAETGRQVLGYTIENGGHTWPGGPQYAPKNFVGLVSHNLNACEVIWAFFKQYTCQHE